jgi:hypothetical protein
MNKNLFSASADEITKVCLTYLSYDIFGTGPSSADKDMRERLKKYPFLKYASKEWGRHASESSGSETREAIFDFLKQDNKSLQLCRQ